MMWLVISIPNYSVFKEIVNPKIEIAENVFTTTLSKCKRFGEM